MICPDRPPHGPAASLTGVLALTCALALPLRAQVTQKPVVEPKPPIRGIQVPQAPAGDLVIVKVTLDPHELAAYLDITNTGTAPVSVPAGSIIARGDPVQAGRIAFSAAKVQDGFSLFPRSGYRAHLYTTGWCPAGKPGAVTLRVNPDNTLGETDKTNNGFTLPAASLIGDIQGAEVWLESQRFPPDGITGLIPPAQRNTLPRGFPADIVVSFHNPGPGYVVVCPGVALLRDVQSPLSGIYGLKTYNYPNVNFSSDAYPGGGTLIKLKSAVGPVVLSPGSYTWQFLLNPQGAIAESNAANNTVTATVTVIPPPSQ